MEYAEFRAMNSDILLAAEGNADEMAQGFREARAFVEATEARLTRFSVTSELSALNRSGGTWFPASEDLYDVMLQARAYFDQTRGLFDPSILDALEAAGYDKSMDDIRSKGASQRTRKTQRTDHDIQTIRFDGAARAIWMPPGMHLDLGGIAKGWIAERAAQMLAQFALACLVDAGGDMFMIGLPRDASFWRVALEDPRDEQATLAVFNVGPGAVATSSVTKRRWQQSDRVRHHLIDPRSAEPAETDWLSVTVIAPHATTAEVFAKSLLIAGSRQAEQVAAQRDDIVFIAVDGRGKLWGSSYAKEYLDVGLEYV